MANISLRNGWFKTTSSDSIEAKNVLEKMISYRGQRWTVPDKISWNERPFDKDNWQSHLLSLRWLDVFVREVDLEESTCKKAWTEYVQSWVTCEEAGNIPPIAWTTFPALERSTTLALGSKELYGTELPRWLYDTIELHVKWITKSILDRLQKNINLHTLPLFIGVYIECCEILDRTDLLRELVFILESNSSFESLHGNNFSKMTLEELEAWRKCLKPLQDNYKLSVKLETELKSTFENALNIFQPNGTKMSFTNKVSSADKLVESDWSASYEYIRTQGLKGSAPESIQFCQPGAFASVRSGWGETEKDFLSETFFGISFAERGGGARALDPSLLSYFFDGVNWLTNHIGDRKQGGGNAPSEFLTTRFAEENDELKNAPYNRLIYSKDSQQVSRFDVKSHFSTSTSYSYLHVEEMLIAQVTPENFEYLIGTQSWVVPKDIEIEVEKNCLRLKNDSNKSALIWTNLNEITNISLSPVISDGIVVARQIQLIVDMQGVDFVWGIRGVRTKEQLSVVVDTKHDVTSLSLKLSAYEAHLKLSTGGLQFLPDSASTSNTAASSMHEAPPSDRKRIRLSRLQTLDTIVETKNEIWDSNGILESRISGIERLLEIDERQEDADFGLMAAIQDIAGEDLMSRLPSNSGVFRLRRSPLISWQTDQSVVDNSTMLPMWTHRSVPDFTDISVSSIHTFDLGDLCLPMLIDIEEGSTLTVSFHGATDRLKTTLPRFERRKSLAELEAGPRMFFGDPGLDLNSSMILDWYMGTERIDVHSKIASIISKFAADKNIRKIILVGSSGGGFAAMQVSSYLNGVSVVAFNPQTDLRRYSRRLAGAACSASFGQSIEELGPDLVSRIDTVSRFEKCSSLPRLILIQNVGDGHHLNNHFYPFMERASHLFPENRLRPVEIDLGPGHVAPRMGYFHEVMNEALSELS
ncbi:hypothetical protein [Arthrobacter sp. UCD-GKA]|uniref:hypothetical protein n=1 Tax=Arthrobacter sp. UCD-GKA TaxID=1913576 RepID=UPI0011145CF9|nr:hypothetical protein [Arthrobacter sp. UCD-GKA]